MSDKTAQQGEYYVVLWMPTDYYKPILPLSKEKLQELASKEKWLISYN